MNAVAKLQERDRYGFPIVSDMVLSRARPELIAVLQAAEIPAWEFNQLGEYTHKALHDALQHLDAKLAA